LKRARDGLVVRDLTLLCGHVAGYGNVAEYAGNHHAAATCAASDDNCGNGDVCSNVAEYAGNHHAAAAASDDNCGNGGNLGDSAVLRGTLACLGSCEHRVRVIHDVRRGDLLFYFNEFSI
jgi:hypothetical protein